MKMMILDMNVKQLKRIRLFLRKRSYNIKLDTKLPLLLSKTSSLQMIPRSRLWDHLIKRRMTSIALIRKVLRLLTGTQACWLIKRLEESFSKRLTLHIQKDFLKSRRAQWKKDCWRTKSSLIPLRKSRKNWKPSL